MYAVFQNGGKQYLVKKGQIINLEKIKYKNNKLIEFNNILLIINKNKILIGKPFIKDSKIIAKIIKTTKDKKIIIIKFNRRKHFKKKQGHRQFFTKVLITNILTK